MAWARLWNNIAHAVASLGLRVHAGRVDAVHEPLGQQLDGVLGCGSLQELRQLVRDFESEFASLLGCRYAIGVDSGSAALYFALRALDIGSGDEVITVPNSWITTVTTIRETGAACVLADIERSSGAIDVEHAARLITPRTRAIVPVHMYGIPADTRAVMALAEKHGLAVVEDACQGAGASFAGRPVGTAGALGCFSFHANKLVGAPFDGGMVCTDSAELAKRVRAMCEPVWDVALTAPQPRVPSRLAPLAVPVLRSKLRLLDDKVRLRTEQAEKYRAALAPDGLASILAPGAEGRASYRSCVLASPRIDAYRKSLRQAGWNLGPMYAPTVEFIRAAQAQGMQLPNASWLAENHLVLPTGESVSGPDSDAICAALQDVANKA